MSFLNQSERPMNILSVCSGIEAASVAFAPLGHRVVGVAEIEPFPCQVLHHRCGAGRPMFMPDPDDVVIPPEPSRDAPEKVKKAYARAVKEKKERIRRIKGVASIPVEGKIPNYGDFTRLIDSPPQNVDMLVGGTPCQAFSISGKREGLADARGNLTLAFVHLADALGVDVPVLWENVPGILNDKTNAFGCLLAGLAGADDPLLPHKGRKWTNAGFISGPRRVVAWVVKDAQYFGLAQRRKRVFVMAIERKSKEQSTALCEALFDFDGARLDVKPARRAA